MSGNLIIQSIDTDNRITAQFSDKYLPRYGRHGELFVVDGILYIYAALDKTETGKWFPLTDKKEIYTYETQTVSNEWYIPISFHTNNLQIIIYDDKDRVYPYNFETIVGDNLIKIVFDRLTRGKAYIIVNQSYDWIDKRLVVGDKKFLVSADNDDPDKYFIEVDTEYFKILKNGNVTFGNNVEIQGALTISGATLFTGKQTLVDDVEIGGNLQVTGTITSLNKIICTELIIGEDVVVGGNMTVNKDILVSGHTVINGDLTVKGLTTYIQTEEIKLADNFITLNANAVDIPTQNAGIEVSRGLEEQKIIIQWDEFNDVTNIPNGLTVDKNVDIHNQLSVADDLMVGKNVQVIGTIDVAGPANFSGTVTTGTNHNIINNLIVGNDASISGDLSIMGSLAVSNITTFNASIVASDTLVVSGQTTFNNTTRINNTLTVDGDAVITGSIDIATNVSVGGNSTFNGNILTNGNVKVVGLSEFVGLSTFYDDVVINGKLKTTGLTTLNGDVQINANQRITGNLQVDGSVNIDGDLTIRGENVNINATNLSVSDNFITLNKGFIGVPTSSVGLEVDRGEAGVLPFITFDEENDSVVVPVKQEDNSFIQDEIVGKTFLAVENQKLINNLTMLITTEATNRYNGDNGLQSQIDNEKSRIDAILTSAGADADSFKEIVDLINSVDTENDTAFAGYVTFNNSVITNIVNGNTPVLKSNTLSVPRVISFSGGIIGSTLFDGSADVSVVASVVNDSHNHTIGTITGLQDALDGKQPLDVAYVHTDNNYTSIDKNKVDYISVTQNTDLDAIREKLLGIESGATSDQTAEEIVALLKTVDGEYSGVDADLLDGQEGTYYQPAASAITTTTQFIGDVEGTYNTLTVKNDSHNHTIDTLVGMQAKFDEKLGINDKAADSILLDGRTGSYYTTYADTKISELVNSSPETLNTLNELSAALGNDPNFATTISTTIGQKLDASTYNANDILDKIKTVDGMNSGLDADLLDGKHASEFQPAGYYVTGDGDVRLTGDITGVSFNSGGTNIETSLSNTGVVAGTYGTTTSIPVVTVDSKGRITHITTNSVLIPSGAINVSGDLTMSGTTGSLINNATLVNTGVTAGTYKSVTVDAKGRVTDGTNPTTLSGYGITDATPSSHIGAGGTAHANVVAAGASGFMTGADKTKLDGIAAGANNYSHPTSGIASGTYRSVTVDTNGHVTAGSNPTTLSGYGITDSITLTELGWQTIISGNSYTTITNPNTYSATTDDSFGASVSMSSSYILIGAPNEDSATATNTGAAYIFNKSGTLLRTLINPDNQAGAAFGSAVIVTEQYAIVSAPNANAVYIFNVSNGTLIKKITYTESGYTTRDLGKYLAVYDDYLFVSAPLTNYGMTQEVGIVCAYQLSTGTYLRTFYNPAGSGNYAYDEFGRSLSANSKYLAIGACMDDVAEVNAGKVYLYDYKTGNLVQTITQPTPVSQAWFGTYMDMSENYLVMGVPTSSAVYVYDVNTLTLSTTLTGAGGDSFGSTVKTFGKYVMVGIGSTAVKIYDSSNWTLANTLTRDPNIGGVYSVDSSILATASAGEVFLFTYVAKGICADKVISGTFNSSLFADTGVTAGTYKSVTVDAKGRVTSGSNPTTLSAYGITDAYNKTESDEMYVKSGIPTTYTSAQRGAIYNIPFSPSIGLDLSISNNFSVTMTSNMTLSNPINMVAGQSGSIIVRQDSVGGRSIMFDSYWLFANKQIPPLVTTPNAINMISYYVFSSTEILTSVHIEIGR